MKLARLFSVFFGAAVLTANSSFAGIVVLSTLAHEYTLAPGEAFEGTIFLRNNGKEPATARVSQTDYRFAADGSNDYGPPGAAPRSNARWFAPSTSLVNIAPGEVAALNYRGRAPALPDLRGTYWSIVMIEDATPYQGANGITTIARYGIQIATHIGETGTRSVHFGKRTFEVQGADHAVVLDIENDGQRLIFPKLWVEVFDRNGTRLGRFGGTSARLYPECSARYRVSLTAVPAGAYKALILADCGDDQIVGTQCELAF